MRTLLIRNKFFIMSCLACEQTSPDKGRNTLLVGDTDTYCIKARFNVCDHILGRTYFMDFNFDFYNFRKKLLKHFLRLIGHCMLDNSFPYTHDQSSVIKLNLF